MYKKGQKQEFIIYGVKCDVEISIYGTGRLANKTYKTIDLSPYNYPFVSLCELWCEQSEQYIKEIYNGYIRNYQILLLTDATTGNSRILILPNLHIFIEENIGCKITINKIKQLREKKFVYGDTYYTIRLNKSLPKLYIFNWTQKRCSCLFENHDKCQEFAYKIDIHKREQRNFVFPLG